MWKTSRWREMIKRLSRHFSPRRESYRSVVRMFKSSSGGLSKIRDMDRSNWNNRILEVFFSQRAWYALRMLGHPTFLLALTF